MVCALSTLITRNVTFEPDSLFSFFNLFNFTGFIHHLSIYHGLGDNFDNLPGSYFRLFYKREGKKVLKSFKSLLTPQVVLFRSHPFIIVQ